MLEAKFKTKLIKDLEKIFPGCIVIHPNPNEIQGFPDLLILYKDKWAALEGKQLKKSHKQANQNYYIELLDDMSFARFIYPENKEEVLYELQQTFGSRRKARIFRG